MMTWLLRVLLLWCLGAGLASAQTRPLPPLFDDIQERTFRYFWETADPRTGLVPDRYPTPSFASIAAVGFGLTAYAVGVEHGWVPRAEAAKRTLATLRFFHDAPQGKDEKGVAGYKGFFYHFLDMKEGRRFADTELSTVDTALLLGGVLFAQSYYDRDDPVELDIRALSEIIYRRVDWNWAQWRAPLIAYGWYPDKGYIKLDWQGYNEAMLIYILALGSPSHPVGPEAWQAWTQTYDKTWGSFQGQTYLNFAPLFGHQYSHQWIDFRDIRDAYMKRRGIDYFENSRRAALAQRSYAIANPRGWRGYGENIWGLTACDGPLDVAIFKGGQPRAFRTYAPRGVGRDYIIDDGTLAPTALIASLPFAPEFVVPATEEMHRRYGSEIYGQYGFLDAFNPSFNFKAKVRHGRVVPDFGWIDTDYLGIDQGPIIAMIENYRSDLVWKVMRSNPHIVRGLKRAGFTGGWLEATPADNSRP